MNKSHITDEQIDLAMDAYCSHKPIWDYKNGMRKALEAAFPEPSIQEFLRDEERSARNDYPQQPAAFGPLVVTEQMALQLWHEINETKTSLREPLQSFVDRHSIKPIAFADKSPDKGSNIFIWDNEYNQWVVYSGWGGSEPLKEYTHWLPASALPIPEAVNAKESAWREFCKEFDLHDGPALRKHFDFIYESAQAGGAK